MAVIKCCSCLKAYPDGKVHGANMGPIWGRQDPGGPKVGNMNFASCVGFYFKHLLNHIVTIDYLF